MATGTVETVVTYLRMSDNPHHHVHPPANFSVALMHAERPTVHFYRYLYDTIGALYNWIDRRRMSDDELDGIIRSDAVDIYVAYAGGVPAGYFELDATRPRETWLAYFGVIRDFQGHGLGKWLLAEAIATAWTRDGLETLMVETCTLDDPRALGLYQRMGFVPYERREKVMERLV